MASDVEPVRGCDCAGPVGLLKSDFDWAILVHLQQPELDAVSVVMILTKQAMQETQSTLMTMKTNEEWQLIEQIEYLTEWEELKEVEAEICQSLVEMEAVAVMEEKNLEESSVLGVAVVAELKIRDDGLELSEKIGT